MEHPNHPLQIQLFVVYIFIFPCTKLYLFTLTTQYYLFPEEKFSDSPLYIYFYMHWTFNNNQQLYNLLPKTFFSSSSHIIFTTWTGVPRITEFFIPPKKLNQVVSVAENIFLCRRWINYYYYWKITKKIYYIKFVYTKKPKRSRKKIVKIVKISRHLKKNITSKRSSQYIEFFFLNIIKI